MSYYEDNSYYCYSEPVYGYDIAPSDPVYYDNSPMDSVYYEDTPTDLDPIYDEDTPSNPIYYDITLDPTGYADTPSHDELETYAEAASNRTYSEDEIHPAYRDQPTGSDHTYFSNTIIPSEDEIHPTYHNPPTNDNYEDLLTIVEPLEDPSNYDHDHSYKDYTWTVHKFDNGVIRYNPPTDPTFYTLSSHDNAPDEDLVETVRLTGIVLEEYREFFIREADDPEWIEEMKPRFNQLTLVSQHVEDVLARRRTDVNDDNRKDCEDDDSNPRSQFTPTAHHDFNNCIVTTPPPDICTPIPLSLSPNIQSKPTRLKSAFLIAALNRREPRYHFGSPLRRRRQPNFRNLTRTYPTPDIRLPKPLPLSPNIRTQPHPYLLENQNCLDICALKTIPLKPNIFAQPRRPPHTRPQRKHPPVQLPTIPTPQNCHRHARRRIFKRSRSHSS